MGHGLRDLSQDTMRIASFEGVGTRLPSTVAGFALVNGMTTGNAAMRVTLEGTAGAYGMAGVGQHLRKDTRDLTEVSGVEFEPAGFDKERKLVQGRVDAEGEFSNKFVLKVGVFVKKTGGGAITIHDGHTRTGPLLATGTGSG